MKEIGGVSLRFARVWQRNLTVYRKTWKIGFIPPLFEPLLYLVALGAGLGAFVGGITYRGETVPYIRFLAPALVAVTVMFHAFYETTYASFVRMRFQRTFEAMLATPLSVEDVVAGEIAWSATKSLIAAALMLAVMSPFGLVSFPTGLLLLPLAFLGGVGFGSLGMYFTGVVPSIDVFNVPVFLVVTPMYLFSSTFFPLEAMPGWAQKIALALPLTHLVGLARDWAFGRVEAGQWVSLAYLAGFAGTAFPLAVGKMRRRLVK